MTGNPALDVDDVFRVINGTIEAFAGVRFEIPERAYRATKLLGERTPGRSLRLWGCPLDVIPDAEWRFPCTWVAWRNGRIVGSSDAAPILPDADTSGIAAKLDAIHRDILAIAMGQRGAKGHRYWRTVADEFMRGDDDN